MIEHNKPRYNFNKTWSRTVLLTLLQKNKAKHKDKHPWTRTVTLLDHNPNDDSKGGLLVLKSHILPKN